MPSIRVRIPPARTAGSKFTSVSGDTYACNGTNGQDGVDGQDGIDGQDGVDGQDGEDFAGSFTSPNGLYRPERRQRRREDRRPELPGSCSTAAASGSWAHLDLLKLQTSVNSLEALSNLALDSAGTLSAHGTLLALNGGALTSVTGALITLNGSGCGVLRPPDLNPFIGPGGGPVVLVPGSPTVRTGC